MQSVQIDSQETEISDKDEQVLLENLDSFEDLLQTLTIRDAELEKQKLELNEGLEELLMQSFESSLNSMESLESKSYHNSNPNITDSDEKQPFPKSRRKSISTPLYTQLITEEPETLVEAVTMKLEEEGSSDDLKRTETNEPQSEMDLLDVNNSDSAPPMEETKNADSTIPNAESKESGMEAPSMNSERSLSHLSSHTSSSSQLYEPFDLESLDDKKRRTSFMETETARKAISEQAKKSRAAMIEKVQIARRASMIHVKELEGVVEKQSELLPDAVKIEAVSASSDLLKKEDSLAKEDAGIHSEQSLQENVQEEQSSPQNTLLGPLIKPPKYTEAELKDFVDFVYSAKDRNPNLTYSYAQIEEYVTAIRAFQRLDSDLFADLDTRDLFYKAQRLNMPDLLTNTQNTIVDTIDEVDENEFENEGIATEMSQKMDELDKITKSQKDLLESLKNEVLTQKENRQRSSLILKNKRSSLNEHKSKSRRSSKRSQSLTSGSEGGESSSTPLVPLAETDIPASEEEFEEELIKKKLQNELMRVFNVYEDLRENVIKELETQTDLKKKLDQSKNQKKALMHETRTLFALDLKLQEKLALLIQWLTEEGPSIVEREKNKSQLLTRAANSQIVKRKQEKAKYSRHYSTGKEQSYSLKKQIEKDYLHLKELNAQMLQLEKENGERVIFSSELSNQVGQKKISRMKLMEQQLAEDQKEREKELNDLKEAIRLQRGDSDEDVELNELEELNFEGKGIGRIPKILKETFRLKHLAMDNNSIKIIEGLNFLTDLLSLSLSKNVMEQVDLSSIPSVKRFVASGNKLGHILGVPENLFLVDVSNNASIFVKDFAPAKNLYVCIFKNSRVNDLSFIEHFTKVLYLDVYNSKVTELELDYIFHCQFLLYLNIGSNDFHQSPTIPSLMIRELDMSFNTFPTFRLDPWYPIS